jgi:hypothetical protein
VELPWPNSRSKQQACSCKRRLKNDALKLADGEIWLGNGANAGPVGGVGRDDDDDDGEVDDDEDEVDGRLAIRELVVQHMSSHQIKLDLP